MDRYQAYRWYLNSSFWKAQRKFILERAQYQCENWLLNQRCIRPAQEVHHLTYLRVFKELPTDLVALCRYCHADLHHLQPANDNQLSLEFPIQKRA
jgi:hypothetical protein